MIRGGGYFNGENRGGGVLLDVIGPSAVSGPTSATSLVLELTASVTALAGRAARGLR